MLGYQRNENNNTKVFLLLDCIVYLLLFGAIQVKVDKKVDYKLKLDLSDYMTRLLD